MQISFELLGFGVIIAFFAGLIQGSTAFGYGLVALPLLMMLIPIKSVVPVIIITGIFLGIHLVWDERKNINIKTIWALIIFGILGNFAGTFALAYINPSMLKKSAGFLIVGTSLLLIFGLKIKMKSKCFSQILAGLFSGFMQGSMALGAAPVILFYSNQGVTKNTFRANISIYLLVQAGFSIIFQMTAGIITVFSLEYALMLVPAAIAGNFIGIYFSSRLSDEVFKKIVLLLVGISGLSCILF